MAALLKSDRSLTLGVAYFRDDLFDLFVLIPNLLLATRYCDAVAQALKDLRHEVSPLGLRGTSR